jgi:hypothetical protein
MITASESPFSSTGKSSWEFLLGNSATGSTLPFDGTIFVAAIRALVSSYRNIFAYRSRPGSIFGLDRSVPCFGQPGVFGSLEGSVRIAYAYPNIWNRPQPFSHWADLSAVVGSQNLNNGNNTDI